MSGFTSAGRDDPPADPGLIAAWLRGRSIARSLPVPVEDHGGWRVDTRSDTEWCRHVHAAPSEGFRLLATTVTTPRIFLKLCAGDETMRRLLPSRWQIQPPSYVMTGPNDVADQTVPAGYSCTIDGQHGAICARITTPGGSLAASGYAAEIDGVFVYDRIVTDADHRRRGLGGAIMARLGAQRRSQRSRQVLVATERGKALYATLGWQVHAPYASAVIPDRDA